MEDVTLSSKQAHDFAMTICFSDILSYIEANKAEYEAFVVAEVNVGVDNNERT